MTARSRRRKASPCPFAGRRSGRQPLRRPSMPGRRSPKPRQRRERRRHGSMAQDAQEHRRLDSPHGHGGMPLPGPDAPRPPPGGGGLLPAASGGRRQPGRRNSSAGGERPAAALPHRRNHRHPGRPGPLGGGAYSPAVPLPGDDDPAANSPSGGHTAAEQRGPDGRLRGPLL